MMQFFGGFSPAAPHADAAVEDTFDQFQQTTLGMVIVFQMPTLAVFLTRMRVETARLLWKQIKYAVLVIFVFAAVLTPSPDPWNQLVFAAPMLGLYLVSILLAWIVSPRGSGAGIRRHAAEARISSWIDREEQALIANEAIQLSSRHAGFDAAIEVLSMDRAESRPCGRDRLRYRRTAR